MKTILEIKEFLIWVVIMVLLYECVWIKIN